MFRNTFLMQGLLLVTLGFITYFAGFKLSLVLGVESVILLVLGRQLQNRVMQFAAYAAAVRWLWAGACRTFLSSTRPGSAQASPWEP